MWKSKNAQRLDLVGLMESGGYVAGMTQLTSQLTW